MLCKSGSKQGFPELKTFCQQQCLHLQVRELIYRELLEYHPHMLADYLSGNRQQPSFMYPSAVDNFKRQFAHLEGGGAYGGAAAGSLCTDSTVVRHFCLGILA